MPTWPKQSQCDTFYGNPRGRDGHASVVWEVANLTRVTPPYRMCFAGKPIKTITVHKKCADSLLRVLTRIWQVSGEDQKKIDQVGASIYGGCYNYRLTRGGSILSMHAYACAIDLDPARNGFHDTTPNFENNPWVVKAFEDEGWIWGGRWKERSIDGMHFQASRVN